MENSNGSDQKDFMRKMKTFQQKDSQKNLNYQVRILGSPDKKTENSPKKSRKYTKRSKHDDSHVYRKRTNNYRKPQ